MEPKLFTKEKNTKAEEFKKYLPVNVQFNYETLAPSLALVEQNFIIPILGNQLFEALTEHYQEEHNDPKFAELLQKVQFSAIRLALWKGYYSISLTISDSGAKMPENSPYRYKEDGFMDEMKNDGFNQLDEVIYFLEENIDHFPEFEQSKYYPTLKNSFITNTAAFNRLYNINNSRLVFLKMKYYIEDVEQVTLPHYIGRKFMEAILNNIDAEKYAPILQQIQKFVVCMAIYSGIAELHKMPTEKGLLFENSNNDGKRIEPLNAKEVERTRKYYKEQADAYKTAFLYHLNTHKEDYPEYAEFGGTTTNSDFIPRKTISKTFFA